MKAFAVLRQISRRHRAGSTLTELATACALDHATAHRILGRLASEGMVARRPGTRHYVLGPFALELGAAAHPLFDPRPAAAESLKRLVRLTGGTAFLNARSGYETVCLAREEGRLPVRALPVEVGARRPLCMSAGGVAMLIALPPRERAAALRQGLAAVGNVGRQRQAAIRKMVRASRESGFGVNQDLIVPGMTGIGMSVLDPRGVPIAALSVTLPSDRLSERGRREVADLLRAEAIAIAAARGSQSEDGNDRLARTAAA
jgi:DNA-binding IclR family transcriptional regulator